MVSYVQDYYCHTIFEFKVESKSGDDGDDSLGRLGTVLAGGRYNGLVQLLGGPEGVPGIGQCACSSPGGLKVDG